VDAGGARLLAVRQGHDQLGQLGVVVLSDEPRHVVALEPAAGRAHDGERRRLDVSKRERAVVGRPQTIAREWERSKNDIDAKDRAVSQARSGARPLRGDGLRPFLLALGLRLGLQSN
jgi:hypothetical protein